MTQQSPNHALRPDMPAPHSPNPWDPIVRLSHWGLAAVIITNALITRGGSAPHLWFGWIGMSLLLLRLVWGLFGTAPARFVAFPPNPLAALRHLGELARGAPRNYPSHNPAGAMMAYGMWAALALVIATGLTMNATQPWVASQQAAILDSGDWSALADTGQSTSQPAGQPSGQLGGENRGMIKSIHEFAANLMLVLAVLHVAGVVIEGRAMRRNLIPPMLLGARDKTRDVL